MTEVHFTGVAFPTMLHAQWALFFEDLMIPWRFRPESFALGGDNTYRPDFWLPRHQVWFQVGDAADDIGDPRRWLAFAAAAVRRCPADDGLAGMSASCELHGTRPDVMLPEPWLGRDALYSVGGIPAAEDMSASGPLSSPFRSMYTGTDCWYQWTACPSCGYVGAEYAGRADRLACGHGDAERDGNPRADDPRILAAYRLARQVTAARFDGLCAECTLAMNPGDLVGAGSPIGRRRWYHADCLLISRRRRYRLHQLATAPGTGKGQAAGLLAG